MAAFMELGMLPELSNAVDEMDWTLPTDIQQEGIPAILGGGDVLMAAETGSGKTGAFCLPIVQIVWETMRDIQFGKYKKPEGNPETPKRPDNAPMCVIIEPTKELAEQTYNQIESFKKFLDTPTIRNALVTGGLSTNEQIRSLEEGCEIITCTPGRVRDLVKKDIILMSHVRFFVLDEADSLVAGKSDSMRTIRELHSKIPHYSFDGQRLQMIVCSATLHNGDVQKLANEFMHFPQWIDLKGQDSIPDTVHQVVCMVDPKADKSWIRLRSTKEAGIKTDGIHVNDEIRPGSDKAETLSEACKVLKLVYLARAIDEHKMDKGIIFCRTKLDCDNCEDFLKQKGHSCVCLHGDRNPNERTENLEKFKDGKVKFLICTDVAARGLDVRGVPYVFNVTLPPANEKANYVHRIGRVGRADRMGLAISLVSTVPEKVWYHQCKSRGANCKNTDLFNKKGCAKWFNEIGSLSAVEEHLGITIQHVDNDFSIPVFEYEGKVSYGSKRKNEGVSENSHAIEMADTVRGLADLEREVQLTYLQFIEGSIN